MAEHNELKYGSPLSNAAAILSGGGYGDVGISRLGETLTPVLDLWRRPEFALPRGERRWVVNPSDGADVANFSQVGIASPTGSNLIVVVEGFWISDGTNRKMFVRAGANVAFTSTSTPNALDTRIPLLTGLRATSFTHRSAAQMGSNMGEYRFLANTTQVFIYNYVLTPGFFFALAQETINVAINATFFGYERVAFPGELTARG